MKAAVRCEEVGDAGEEGRQAVGGDDVRICDCVDPDLELWC
jgi:hypothetical protein